jgi:hypothetical protein
MGGGGMGKVRNEYEILVGKPERKRLLGRSRHKWKDNTQIGFKERGFYDVD